MVVRYRLQLRGLFFGCSVVQKIAAADLRTGEVLAEPGLAQWWMDLDVKVKSSMRRVVGGRLVQHHHVRKRHAPQIVESNQRLAQHGREVRELGGGAIRQA